METAEFLGGKYQKPEQIKPDPVHTFKTKEVSTGRTVFVHRVSTTEAPAEQASLLRLLMSAVFRSPSARNLILDYGEEQGFWYVITQGEPQCLQLREWLQFEIDHAGGTAGRTQTSGEAPAAPTTAATDDPDRTQLATPKVGILTPESPSQNASRETGEFTRMFQPGAKQEGSPVWNDPAKPVESKRQPGEFTRMFLAKTEAAAEEPKPAPPPPPDRIDAPGAKADKPPVEDGPGEFTRFFQGASPAAKNPSEPFPAQDRLQTREVQRPSGGVQRAQRPSTPLPQRPSSEPGEFTKLFSRAPESAAPERRASNLDDMFERAPATPSAPPASAPEPGEYTRIFGKGDLGPPAQQPSSVAPQATASILHDPVAPPGSPFQSANQTTRQVAKPAPAPPPAAQAPSEYTAVLRGLGGSEGGARSPAGEQAHSAPVGGASSMKLPQAPPIPGVQPPKMPPAAIPHKPAAPGGAMPQVKLPEAPKAAAPAASNKKLIIFFCVLGILTLVLIVLIALIALKK